MPRPAHSDNAITCSFASCASGLSFRMGGVPSWYKVRPLDAQVARAVENGSGISVPAQEHTGIPGASLRNVWDPLRNHRFPRARRADTKNVVAQLRKFLLQGCGRARLQRLLSPRCSCTSKRSAPQWAVPWQRTSRRLPVCRSLKNEQPSFALHPPRRYRNRAQGSEAIPNLRSAIGHN